jgi:hypothetical protein
LVRSLYRRETTAHGAQPFAATIRAHDGSLTIEAWRTAATEDLKFRPFGNQLSRHVDTPNAPPQAVDAVASAWLRRYPERWESIMDQEAGDARFQHEFHIEEFKMLKTELMEDAKAAAFNFRFALFSSGAVAAWVVEHEPVNLVAAALPLLISGLMFGLNWGLKLRADHRRAYLERLETYLAWSGFGFENNGKPTTGSGNFHLSLLGLRGLPGFLGVKQKAEQISAEDDIMSGHALGLSTADAICWIILLTFSILFFLACILVVV